MLYVILGHTIWHKEKPADTSMRYIYTGFFKENHLIWQTMNQKNSAQNIYTIVFWEYLCRNYFSLIKKKPAPNH